VPEVRIRVRIQHWGLASAKVPLAEEWLLRKSQEQDAEAEQVRRASNAEQMRIARSAKNAAWIAAIAAMVAAIIAAVAAVIAYLSVK
jgi:type IV secretory pathway component VirB8